MDRIGQFRIGTSGIALAGNKQSFPQEYQTKSRLNYYSSIFNSIEINSSFYKVPMPSTFVKWANDVSPDFRFTLKLWNEITHIKELDFEISNIDKFINSAVHLGEKKGCLLIQFPGKISLDYYQKVELILHQISESDKENSWKKAVEFRNSTWYVRETYELLDEFSAGMVLHDFAKSKNDQSNEDCDFVYYRFHGPTGNYRGDYEIAHLRQQAERIHEWLHQGKDVYAHFNNTAGNAYENAVSLKKLIMDLNVAEE